MSQEHEPLLTDPRSYESEDGDVLPLEIMEHPVQPMPDYTEYMMIPVPDSELEGPVTRMLQKALAEKALQAQAKGIEDKNLDVATVLELLHKDVGFYARNNEEKNTMQGIMGFADSGFPTLHFLDVVEYHQRDAKTDDPVAALRSHVRRFEGYATQSHNEVRINRLFANTIAERDFDEKGTLAETLSAEDLRDDALTRRTLTSLARLRETDLYVEGEGNNPLGVRAGVDSLKEKALVERILTLLGDMPIGDILKMNDRLIDEENHRFDYWKTRLTEARMRSSIKAQVDESLQELDELRPATRN